MKKIEYREKDILSVLKDINEFVVSLDQINKVHHEFGMKAWEDEIIEYLTSKKVSNRLASIRTVLSEPFPTELGEDDMGFLEREMQNVEYWTFKSYLNKHKGKS